MSRLESVFLLTVDSNSDSAKKYRILSCLDQQSFKDRLGALAVLIDYGIILMLYAVNLFEVID
jgi:hypothetical protein